MLGHREVGEKPLSRQWFRQERGMPEISLEVLKGSFTLFGPGKFFVAPKNVEKWEMFVSRTGDKPV